MQEYLAEAYRLAHYKKAPPYYVSTSALAEVLGVSAPAVTRMVQRLKEAGYLEHEPYQGIILTPDGEKAALDSIRRHRIVERFLTDVMGFGWHEVHDIADELGTTISDAVLRRMEAMAGYPRRCPHGEPIPSVDGVLPLVVDQPLIEAEVQQEYMVSRANSHNAEVLKYLDTLGLKTGVKLELIERAPFNGPLHIRVNDQPHFIGHDLGRVLRVCTVEEFERV
jgi:DtxR family Mn-dependent transcriptional regulator